MSQENSNVQLKRKHDPSKKPTTNDSGKSGRWIFVFLGVLILGFGIWFFTNKSKSDKNVSNDSARTNSGSNTQQKNDDNSVGSNPSTSDINNAVVNSNTSEPITANEGSSKTSTQDNENPNSGAQIVSTANKNQPEDASLSALNNKIPATFGSASATLNRVDDKLVTEILNYLSKNVNSKITVNGYASSDGLLSENISLSQKRATAFKNYLIEKGISAERIVVVGKGIENPIGSNDTEEGRSKNRRVEIVL